MRVASRLAAAAERHPWLSALPGAARSVLRAYPVVLLVLLVGTRDLAVGGLLQTPAFAVYSAAAVVYALVLLRRGRRGDSGAPTLSVVVPALDGEDAVERTIEACLAPSTVRPPAEVVAVNDCSADRTWVRILSAKARHPTVHAVDLGRRYGKRAAMIEGARRAGGEVVCFAGCGEDVDAASLDSLVEVFADASVDAVTRSDGHPLRFVPVPAPALLRGPPGEGAVAFRRAFLLEHAPEVTPATLAGSPSAGWPAAPAQSVETGPRLVQAFPPGVPVYLDGEPSRAPGADRRSRGRGRVPLLRPSTALAALPLLVLPIAGIATLSAAGGPTPAARAAGAPPAAPVLSRVAAAEPDPVGASPESARLPQRVVAVLASNPVGEERSRPAKPRRQPRNDPKPRSGARAAPPPAQPAVPAAQRPDERSAPARPPKPKPKPKPAAPTGSPPPEAPAPTSPGEGAPPASTPSVSTPAPPPRTDPPQDDDPAPPEPGPAPEPQPGPGSESNGNGNGNGNGKGKGHEKHKVHGQGAAGGPPGRVGK